MRRFITVFIRPSMSLSRLFPFLLIFSAMAFGQSKSPSSGWLTEERLSPFSFRSLGPANTSGRVVDLAVNPLDHSEYYVVAGSSGVWKTNNGGLSFQPVLESEGAYSMGCIALDPSNPNVVWVGSGENNNQRSVGYGDGLYKSVDAGKSWTNVGLKTSEHIGRIVVDPRNSDVVWVAAYGPLWSSGGERGIYKTTDGGKTWKRTLFISENTGCNEVWIDPHDNRVLYAAAHQRRRHEFTYISGGPESGVYKSTDGGETWSKINKGLPTVEMGRIGLAVSPRNPNLLYAIVEAADRKGGFFRSTDRGESWEKMSSHSTAGNYYCEIIPDPKDERTVYSMDTWMAVTHDGGKSFDKVGERNKHVDNHAIWIDPADTRHLLAGCDGGLYETFDLAKTWIYKANLPITQFYKVCTDNSKPFFYIYGGTQDNNSMGGPSRTTSASGILNSDWFITTGGDGFESQVDPLDPNTVYSQSQYGGLVRFDRVSGEQVDIKPDEEPGDAPLRWNWDAPLVISRFNNQRLYFAANKIFRSNDRGNTWEIISSDLSKQIDRNRLPVMGKVWSMDAVAKNQSTTVYGNITTLAESPLSEQLLGAGTDDGNVCLSSDGGKTWATTSSFTGVPATTFVNSIVFSHHSKTTLYATFNNHRNGDFKPYVMCSQDGGKSWKSIVGNLPSRGSAYCIMEDPKLPGMLVLGTEFGLFLSLDAGAHWTAWKGGLPTICVRDMAFHERDEALVLATFGRGFYILDHYREVRNLKQEFFDADATLFPVSDAVSFYERTPLGHKGKSFQGEGLYTASNPPVEATFFWHLKEDVKSMKDARKARESVQAKANRPVFYPSKDSLRLEDQEEAPYLLFTIRGAKGQVVRRLKADAKKGMHSLGWDLRYASVSPVSLSGNDPDNPYDEPSLGRWALPGQYTVSAELVHNGVLKPIMSPQTFQVKALEGQSFVGVDLAALDAFYEQTDRVMAAVSSIESARSGLKEKLSYLRPAVLATPALEGTMLQKLTESERILNSLGDALVGDGSLSKREFEVPTAAYNRVVGAAYSLYRCTSTPTTGQKKNLQWVNSQLNDYRGQLKQAETLISAVEDALQSAGGPYTPGRKP